MLGQLQDAGNTTTLAHYLKLLESAFLASGLELFSRGKQSKRGSSPKLVLWNNALVNALSTRTFAESLGDWTEREGSRDVRRMRTSVESRIRTPQNPFPDRSSSSSVSARQSS